MKLTRPVNIILTAGLVAGTADALAAIFFYTVVINAKNIGRVFQTIASGLFGHRAYSGSVLYAVSGLLLHYLIACSWATLYYFISRRFSLGKSGLLKSICIGLIIWLVMNLVVLPVSRVPVFHYSTKAVIKGILILIAAIGIPFVCIINPGKVKREK